MRSTIEKVSPDAALIARKRTLFAEVRATLERERETMERAAKIAHAAATHEDSKPENDKDTRGLELAYLAGAQAGRARDIEAALLALARVELRAFRTDEPIGSGALITVSSNATTQIVFMLPAGGGQKLMLEDQPCTVLSPTSPLGSALLGLRQGEVAETTVKGRLTDVEVVRVE